MYTSSGAIVSYLGKLPGRRVGMALQSMLITMSFKICELVHFLVSAPRRKHLVGQVIDVVPHPVVGMKKCLECFQVLSIVFV
jgi:hypothetical protein